MYSVPPKSSSYKMILIFSLTLLSYPYVIHGLVCKGCLELDELIFDKLLAKFSTVLVKFDIAFPYGIQHDEFAKFAREISESNYEDMIVSVVGIKNYGDHANKDLAEKFYINDKLPSIKLFTNGNLSKWSDFPKDKNITVENLRQFIRRNSNIKIKLPDCLKQFDELAKKFMTAIHLTSSVKSNEVEAIVNEATSEAVKLGTKHNQQIAQIYLLIMRCVVERDVGFIEAERIRLQQILDGKISDQKRKEINQKLNILSAFYVIERVVSTHTEL